MQKSRWREIAEELRADIESGRYHSGDRLPSSVALAELRGVSRLTAHKALEDLQREGLVTRKGRRGTVVCAPKSKRKGRIAFIVDQIDYAQNFPRPELLAGIHEGLGEEYNLLICDSKASTEREIDLLNLMSEESDGILCWPTDKSQAANAINRLAAKHVPMVLLDRVPEGAIAEAVVTNSVAAMRQALEFLIERGHERIALLSFDKPEVSTVVERCGTFEAVMAEHGLSAPELVRRFPASLEVSERAYFSQVVHDALFALVRSSRPATAVLCVQDLFGVAVLSGAADMGLEIPDDLEVVTFNDWPPMWLLRPWQAHRIAIHPEDMGRAAITSLRAQIAGAAGAPGISHIEAKFIAADGLLSSSLDFVPT